MFASIVKLWLFEDHFDGSSLKGRQCQVFYAVYEDEKLFYATTTRATGSAATTAGADFETTALKPLTGSA